MSAPSNKGPVSPASPSTPPEGEHKYQSAKGCLIMLAIAVGVLGISVLLVYFFAQPAGTAR